MGTARKKIIGAISIVVVLLLLFFIATKEPTITPTLEQTEPTTNTTPVETTYGTADRAVIGQSVEGRSISVRRFGTGPNHLLFVGGIHGGYEWNSVVLAEEFISYLEKNPSVIPATVSISVIPNLNPDGVFKVLATTTGFTSKEAIALSPTVVSAGRFNANDVDINRNFDCKWQPTSTWRGSVVSAGTEPFSEPEAKALRDFVLNTKPTAAFFWHSQANTVYASECEAGVLPETLRLMNTYATATNYDTQATFDAYPITGDAEGWLASINIPAITIELEKRTDSEWERNLAGVKAILNLYTSSTE